MDPQLKKKLIIATSVGIALVGALFIKNKIQQNKFIPVERKVIISVMRKAKKDNYLVLKQVAMMSVNLASQMTRTGAQIDPQMTKTFLQSPQSPFKMEEMFVKNFTTACQSQKITYAQFVQSTQYYINKLQDPQIKSLADESQADYQLSLRGKLPEIKVVVPASLTPQRLCQIHKKLSLQRYLMKLQIFRKVRGKSQAQLMSDPQLMKQIPNPEAQQQKILVEEGLGENDQPAIPVFTKAIQKYKNEPGFKQNLLKIENHYAKIYNKYKDRFEKNRITEDQIHELEDELIYSPI